MFRAKRKPLFLRRITVKTVAPALVIPSARADVCFAAHSLDISNPIFGARVWHKKR
jgi:hypothetical protein